jgi:hypothetical protein
LCVESELKSEQPWWIVDSRNPTPLLAVWIDELVTRHRAKFDAACIHAVCRKEHGTSLWGGVEMLEEKNPVR